MFLISSAYKYINIQQSIFPTIEKRALNILDDAVQEMDENFTLLKDVGVCIQKRMNTGDLKPEDLEDYLTKTIEKHPSVFGVGILYEPHQAQKSKKLYAPYVIQDRGRTLYKPIEEMYDYTKKEYYKQGINKGAGWIEPYFGPVSNAMLAEYVIPFFAPDDTDKTKPLGIIIVNYSLKRLQELISRLPLGQTGYGFIISEEGRFATHPLHEYLTEEKTLFDVAKETGDDEIENIGKKAIKESSGALQYSDPLTGSDSWVFFEKIPENNWTLLISFVKGEVVSDQAQKSRRALITLIGALIVFATIISIYIGNIFRMSNMFLWLWSGFVSLIFIIGIGTLWYIQIYHTTPDISASSTIILDKTGLEEFLKKRADEDAIKVPTGINVDYLKFVGLNQISLVGSIWQKYLGEDERDKIKRAFTLPMAHSFESDMIYKKNTRLYDLTSWNFNTDIYQKYFDYRNFPFDYKHVQIHIKPEGAQTNVVFTPDLATYSITNPAALPGINHSLKLNGWHILQSYFDYTTDMGSSNFQIQEYLGEYRTPQLSFNIILQRSFINSFISHIVPLVLALIFLFFGLRSMSIGIVKNKATVDVILTPIALTISIFFAVIIAHTSLRDTLKGQPLFYLEYFYIIAYIIMLAVLIILFSVFTQNRSWIIIYRNLLIPQILYWPLLLGLSLASTFWMFY
jgi:hypothetical protein